MVTKGFLSYIRMSHGKWFFLCHALLISMFIFPLFPEINTRDEKLFFWLINCVIIGTIAWGVCYKMKEYYVVLSLFAFLLLLLFFPATPWTEFFELAITLFLYAYAICILLKSLTKAATITQEEVFGVSSIYLLMGFMWSIAYTMVEHYAPGSFSPAQADLRWADLLYYSFITLTTTGFGDIVPLTGLARSLTMLETVSGILFIAIVMTQIISIHVSSRKKIHTPD